MTAKTLPQPVYIVSAKRTPFGKFGGKLKKHTATDLGVVAAKAALEAAKVSADQVDHVVFGNVAQTSTDAIYLARHVGLRAGTPIDVPALTVNRLCGSGFQAIVSGAHEILLNDADIVLVGGTESMSQAPYAVRDARWGTRLGKNLEMEDTLWSSLTDSYCGCPMAITAENLGAKYDITRAAADEYGLRSQKAWAAAHEAGRFKAEMAPIELETRKGKELFEVDEHPRPDATLEGMGKLPAAFKKDGLVSAGNASGICDGAGALLLASEAAVKKHGLSPLARVTGWHVAGVEPDIMGFGPVPAIRGALERVGQGLDAMDLIEINEAFAPQYLACEKELGLDRDKTNVNGGAIALGHPLGATGAKLMTTLLHELERTGGRYGLQTMCEGGGQANVTIIERL